MSLRSPMGRVLGLGSAKAGTDHWWAQRLTSIALVFLGLWFLAMLLVLPNLNYDTVYAWLSHPSPAFFCVLLIAVAAYHSFLGVQVVIEDYVHGGGAKMVSLLALRFAHVLVGGAAIFAVLRLAFGRPSP